MRDVFCKKMIIGKMVNNFTIKIMTGTNDKKDPVTMVTVNDSPFYTVYYSGDGHMGKAQKKFKEYVKQAKKGDIKL